MDAEEEPPWMGSRRPVKSSSTSYAERVALCCRTYGTMLVQCDLQALTHLQGAGLLFEAGGTNHHGSGEVGF